MNSDEISKIAVELDGILGNMPMELVNKIPQELRRALKEIKQESYQFNYDNSKTLKEQKISPKTRGILAYLYKEYLCSNAEKNIYNKKYYNYIEKQEEIKRKKYNPNNIFKS
ncbi:MAG: hypothetical protein IKF83_03135 [Clostridia bacterium]|nr:hypothetical protein [Clostridia bacterium]